MDRAHGPDRPGCPWAGLCADRHPGLPDRLREPGRAGRPAGSVPDPGPERLRQGRLVAGVILGFVGYGLWQASEAAWGHRTERDDRKRTASRIESAVKAVIYLLLAVVAFRVVTGTSTGGQGGEQVTAKLLQLPGGEVLGGVAGVGIVAAGVVLAWRGLQTKFEEHLDLSELGPGAPCPRTPSHVVRRTASRVGPCRARSQLC